MIDAEHYLFHCYRYIEMNPVRANMVKKPDEYRWSSYAFHAWGKENEMIDDHELYFELGSTNEERQYAYRELFRMDLTEEHVHQISRASNYNYPLGNVRFKELIERTLQRKVGYDKRGRPKRVAG